ncbi:MAG: hypothetical protein GX493_11635 [Firmicutes bacterium]|nr:hypothetical protein [Bacillota bacterium]
MTYVLSRKLEDEEAHGRATKAGLEKYYKRFARCLATIAPDHPPRGEDGINP